MAAGADGPRSAKPEELPETVELIDLVFRTSVGKPPTMAREFPLLLSAGNCHDLYITKVDGQVVSHVGVYRQTIVCDEMEVPVASLGSVCTHPDYRGRGLAGELADLAIERCRQGGCLLMPISGRRTLYTRRDACQIAPAESAIITAEQLGTRAGQSLRIDEYEGGCLDEIVALQGQRAPRYLWSARTLEALLNCHLDMSSSAWTARDSAGTLVGLLVVAHRGPMVGRDPTVGKVVNHVGSPETFAPLAAMALGQLEIHGLRLAALPGEGDLLAVMRALDVVPETASSGWTLKVLDLPGLLQRCAQRLARVPDLSLRAADDGSSLTVTLSGGSVTLDGPEQINAVLFNGPSAWPQAVRQLPAGPRQQLRRVLPLPIPGYGLNYI